MATYSNPDWDAITEQVTDGSIGGSVNSSNRYMMGAMAFIGNGPKPQASGKFYVSRNNRSKLATKLYASRNNQTVEISKLYGSYNGQTKLIWGGESGPKFDPNNPDWSMLADIVRAGQARNVLNVGQEITAYYNSKLCPLIVVDFRTVTLSDNTTRDNVPILMSKYGLATTSNHNQAYDATTSGNIGSTVNNLLTGFGNDFASQIRWIYVSSGDNSTYTSNSVTKQMWLPSTTEIGQNKYNPNNTVFEYFNGASLGTSKYIRYNVNNINQAIYWRMRNTDRGAAYHVSYNGVLSTSYSTNSSYPNMLLPCCAFTGK